MSDRLEWYDITVPANTPKTSPVTFPLVFNQGVVTEIDVKILDGPCGTLGFFITAGGSQYVPRTVGSFVIPNDDYLVWPVENAITSGSWGLVAYNIDSFTHLVQVAFHVKETDSAAMIAVAQTGSGVDSLTSALSVVSPDVSGLPDALSADALINSTPLGSTVTSIGAPLDVAALLEMVSNGTP